MDMLCVCFSSVNVWRSNQRPWAPVDGGCLRVWATLADAIQPSLSPTAVTVPAVPRSRLADVQHSALAVHLLSPAVFRGASDVAFNVARPLFSAPSVAAASWPLRPARVAPRCITPAPGSQILNKVSIYTHTA